MDLLVHYKEQETCRISPDDLQLIHEAYEEITGDTKKIPIGRFIPMAVAKAIQVAKAKVIDNPEHLKLIESLKQQLIESQLAVNSNGETATGLQMEVERLKTLTENLQEENRILREAVPGEAIILNFDETKSGFFKAALAIYQWKQKANTMEEMIWSIIIAFQGIGQLRFDPEDIEYLKSLAEKNKEAE